MPREMLMSPYFWFFFCALFLGMAISRSTRRLKKDSKREKESNRKWFWVCVYLIVCIVMAILGLVLPEPAKIKDAKLLYFVLIVTAYFFIAFRFKKAFGLPSFLLLITLFVVILLFLQSLAAYTGETEISRVTVLKIAKQSMTLEVARPGRSTVVFDLKGNYFEPLAQVVIFDDWLVFFGFKTWYRFVGIAGFVYEDDKYIQSDVGFYFSDVQGISRGLFQMFQEHEKFFRGLGVKTVQVSAAKKRVMDEYQTYALMLQNDADIQIVAK